MSTSCACQPVQFCQPPNWHTDFPDLIGPTGPSGAVGPAGPTGHDGPAAVAAIGLKATLQGDLETGQEYILDLKAWDAYTITDVAILLDAGTATVTLKIDDVAITGLTSIAAGTVIADYLGTAANAVSIGSKVSIAIDAATNAFNLSLSINTIPA